jgi:integrase
LEPGKYRPLTNINWAWTNSLRLAGITDFHIHDLRHEAATSLYETGNSERVIRSIAGWKTNMLDIYWHKDGLKAAQKAVFAARPEAPVPLGNVAAV